MKTIHLAVVLVAAVGIAQAAEIPLTQAVRGPAAANQLYPSIASDGDGFFAICIDYREHRDGELYGSRITRDGRLLDETGIPLGVTDVWEAAVVWTGSSYLVVWQSARGSFQIGCMRIDRDGHILESKALLTWGTLGSVVRAGNRIVIGYLRGSPYALFLDQTAEFIARVDLADAGSGGPFGEPKIVWNGTQLAAFWNGVESGTYAYDPSGNAPYTIKAVRFDSRGVTDTTPREFQPGPDVNHRPREIRPSIEYGPLVASDGNDYLLATISTGGTIAAQRITADLSASIGLTGISGIENFAALLWTGSRYVMIGSSHGALVGQALDRDGRIISGTEIVIENEMQTTHFDGYTPTVWPGLAAATNGTDLLVAWNGRFTGSAEFDLYGRFLSSVDGGDTRILISAAGTVQTNPVVAVGAQNLLLVWSEPTGTYAKRAALSGTPIDSVPVRLAPAASQVKVTFCGDAYLAVWIDGNSVITRRIAASGELRADAGGRHETSGSVQSVALATLGSSTVVVWTELQSNSVVAARLQNDGAFLDTVPVTIVTETATSPYYEGMRDLYIAPSTDRFLVVWERLERHFFYNFGPRPAGVRAARVTPGLTSLDPNGFDIAVGGDTDGCPGIAWNGSEWLVVWNRISVDGIETRGRRIRQDGTSSDEESGTLIALYARNTQGIVWLSGYESRSVSWDGKRYFLTWRASGTVHAAWLENLGSALQGETELRDVQGDMSHMALFAGRVVLEYSRIDRTTEYGGVGRAFVNVMDFPRPRRRSVR